MNQLSENIPFIRCCIISHRWTRVLKLLKNM